MKFYAIKLQFLGLGCFNKKTCIFLGFINVCQLLAFLCCVGWVSVFITTFQKTFKNSDKCADLTRLRVNKEGIVSDFRVFGS